MSPIERSTLVVGTSSTGIAREQSRLPNSPDWILAFRDPRISGGSHPISSSSPTCRSRSARLSTSIRLGLGSTKCGSWNPFPSDSTSTRFPPTSFASEPSVGLEETTWRTASSATMGISTSARPRNSVRMGAVRADGILELQEGGRGPVRHCLGNERRSAARMLGFEVGADARKLARLERQACSNPLGPREDRAGGYAHDVPAHAQEPASRELVDDLRVAAAVPLVADAV